MCELSTGHTYSQERVLADDGCLSVSQFGMFTWGQMVPNTQECLWWTNIPGVSVAGYLTYIHTYIHSDSYPMALASLQFKEYLLMGAKAISFNNAHFRR